MVVRIAIRIVESYDFTIQGGVTDSDSTGPSSAQVRARKRAEAQTRSLLPPPPFLPTFHSDEPQFLPLPLNLRVFDEIFHLPACFYELRLTVHHLLLSTS
ncbi:hypothetical protein CRG98_010814 [Punica granatum]|uniref:Uncharacterized protein n=1 Tax=Punica granatum TaxID=22663 RepID=A0A2I0KJR7_PUNGR|nr:hypothetical protein CRG98_010814 [Punica granatum]